MWLFLIHNISPVTEHVIQSRFSADWSFNTNNQKLGFTCALKVLNKNLPKLSFILRSSTVRSWFMEIWKKRLSYQCVHFLTNNVVVLSLHCFTISQFYRPINFLSKLFFGPGQFGGVTGLFVFSQQLFCYFQPLQGNHLTLPNQS